MASFDGVLIEGLVALGGLDGEVDILVGQVEEERLRAQMTHRRVSVKGWICDQISGEGDFSAEIMRFLD